MAKRTVEEWRKIPEVYKIGDKEYPFRTCLRTDSTKSCYHHSVMYYDLYRKRNPLDS